MKTKKVPKKLDKVANMYADSCLDNWQKRSDGDHPASVDGKFKVGDFVTAHPESRAVYSITVPSIACYVSSIMSKRQLHTTGFGAKSGAEPRTPGEIETMCIIPLSDTNSQGRDVPVNHMYFRAATDEEVNARISEASRARGHLKTHAFRTGDPVELTRNVKVYVHGFMSSGWQTLKRGTACIVDVSPGENDESGGGSHKATMSNSTEKEFDSSKVVEVPEMTIGKHSMRDFVAPSVSIYFPEMELEHLVGVESIKPRQPEMQNVNIILPPGYMEKLHMICRRVTDDSMHEAIYERMGLHKTCQKGRGAIALMYGPPGTGKTMTAEMLSEQIGRPLIKLNLGSIMQGDKMAKKLAEGFARAKRYRAVLLLDEVDIFIRARGGSHPVFDENTSMFLRVLEWYDGILLMTTNLANQIDPAVFSRVHVCLEYGNTSADDRKAIWESLLPRELMACMAGSTSHHENMFDQLKDVRINGREIKMVVQNVVTSALSDLRVKHGDLAKVDLVQEKCVKMELLLEEAKALEMQREMMKA